MAVRLELYINVVMIITLSGCISFAVTENKTVIQGEMLILNCSIDRNDSSHLQWSNPHGFIAFHNNIRGLRDRRYKLIHWSKTELTISLSNISVKDKGTYTCSYYSHPVTTRKINVDVLAPPSNPSMELKREKEKKILKCFTTGSYPAPNITWSFHNELELDAHTQNIQEGKRGTFTTVSTLVLKSHKSSIFVDCIVQHKALGNNTLTASINITDITPPSQPLVEEIVSRGRKFLKCSTTGSFPAPKMSWSFNNGVEIDAEAQHVYIDEKYTSTSILAIVSYKPQLTVYCIVYHEALKNISLRASISFSDIDATTKMLFKTTQSYTRSINAFTKALQETTVTPNTGLETSKLTSTDSTTGYSQSTDKNESLHLSTPVYESASVSEEGTTEFLPGNYTTNYTNEELPTDSNTTSRMVKKQSGTLLIIMVTSLICALLVIVQFFLIKLRKAHALWKKETEESDQSLESNKSKSSAEEKHSQERKTQGITNYNYMQHTIEFHKEEETEKEAATVASTPTNKKESERFVPDPQNKNKAETNNNSPQYNEQVETICQSPDNINHMGTETPNPDNKENIFQSMLNANDRNMSSLNACCPTQVNLKAFNSLEKETEV
ncbi:cytotoxic and regulatory T-cell molecule isoform X3 [Erpetoichthys calabaricus]|uniref:cytotoxic and regulatory T-cell molecule isoform X3 n=1 Tax=Erpetoichthys calabaricus TaxID=27687 RepID=UPI0010A0B87D|nr:cytotoxic and regulatory T-cell molecule isoform X3 [Erpetoichthys calabaricus]